MKAFYPMLQVLGALCLVAGAVGADSTSPAPANAAPNPALVDLLKSSGLTSDQFLSGTKSGLGTAVDLAATELTKPGAFQLSGPSSMGKLQTVLMKTNQSSLLDGFKASLNQVAMTVAPQVTTGLKTSIGTLTLDDAATLASGAPDSATRLLRKAAEPPLRTKLMPFVEQAIAANGTAAKAKDLATKAGPLAAMLGVPNATDLENYLLTQVLETSFGFIAKQEAALRANPNQLKDADAAKVFSLGKK
jgi:hypothetical protein